MRAYRRILLDYRMALAHYEQREWGSSDKPPYWIPLVVEPLALKLVKFYPGYVAEVLGPFGLGSKVSIHFHRADLREQYLAIEDHSTRSPVTDEMWQHCRSITFSPRHLWTDIPRYPLTTLHICVNIELAWVDESVDIGEYTRGTIGEMNGFNHPETLIPKDVSLSWFKDKVR